MKTKMEEKFDKLLKLVNEEDFYISDFLAMVCCCLSDSPRDEYKTSFSIGGKFFEIEIKKKGIM